MKKICLILSLIGGQSVYGDALSSISSAFGNLMSKKESETFIKYRTSAEYSKFFSIGITSSNELKAVYEQYQQFNNNWKMLSVSKYNQQVPDLNAKLEKPITFARMYDVVDYLINKSGAYIAPPPKQKWHLNFYRVLSVANN